MRIRQGTDAALLEAISEAEQALVFLSVSWSKPALLAQETFVGAAGQLAQLESGIECFLVDEEDKLTQKWLRSLDGKKQEIPSLGTGFALGAGSVLWLQKGLLVDVEIIGQQLRARTIVAKCRQLWDPTMSSEQGSTGQSQTGQSQTGQSQTGQSQTGQSQTGQSRTDVQRAEQQEADQQDPDRQPTGSPTSGHQASG